MDSSLPQPLNNSDGEDISGIFDPAWQEAGIPRVLLLAGVLAESGLNPRAERWGRYTTAARTAIATGDSDWLASIISAAWPDISFGYSQRIVLYHDTGDRSPSVDNCLAVRAHVFDNPAEDLLAMANRLRACLDRAGAVDLGKINGDRELGALVIYNAGHWPDPSSEAEAWWWESWAGNVASYATMLRRLRG